MSEKDKMSRMEALLNKRLSAIESKLDDLQSTSDSRTARLSDKVSSLQATVDYMTTLIEQLSEKAQFRQNDEKFEPVQIEAFEDQLLPAKDDEIAHDMIEENASLIDPNPETRSMDSTNSFAIIPTGMATNEALKRGSRTISETSSFAEIEDDISESGTLIEDADEVVEKEEHHANASNDDQVERNEDVSPQNNEPRENDELQAKENGEDCLSIEYAKQRESIKKIQDRIFEESKSSASSTSSPTVSRQSSESSSTASRWSESTREQHNAMVEKQLRELRGELSDASIIAHSVGDGFTPMNSTNSVPSTRSSLTDSINLDVRVDPFLTNDNIIPAPPRTSPSASLNARQQEESRTQDLASRMASAAPFEPRFQIPLSAMETDPNRNQIALSRAFEQNHSFATVVNQAADSTSHPRISNAEAVAAVNALKREFGEEHEPLIVAAMKKFSGNANQCKAFLNSRQLTTQFLIAKFRLEDLDCQVDLETLAQLTVTYDNISQVVNDYIEFEFQQQAMAPEAPRRRGAEHDHHLFGVDRLIQFVSQKANEISSIISH